MNNKELLYKKLNALRLEVDGSIVDSIKSTVDDLFNDLKTNKMAKTIRAKFNVASITKYGNGGGMQVTLYPVTSGSDENKAFWQATPQGEIKMHIDNPNAVFELGEYYVDFTPAEFESDTPNKMVEPFDPDNK